MMKNLLLILLLIFSGQLEAQTLAASQLKVPLSEPGKPYKLSLDLKSATVNLSVYSGKDIAIDITSMRKKEQPSAGNGMLLIHSGSSNDIIAQEKNNAVSITSGPSGHDGMVMVNIKIPAGATALKLTVSEGAVAASDISGDIEANNVHGNISLTNVSGSVVASSNQGNLKVIFKSVNPNAAMAFSTLRGNIDISLPATFKGNVKLRSYSGSIYSDFDIAAEKTADKTTQTATDGVQTLGTDTWINGKINGGGQELIMKTYRGNIYLHKTK